MIKKVFSKTLVTIFCVILVKCEENNFEIKDFQKKELLPKTKDPPTNKIHKIPNLNNIHIKNSYTDQNQIYYVLQPSGCLSQSCHNQLQYVNPIFTQLKETQQPPQKPANALQYQPIYPSINQGSPCGNQNRYYHYHQEILAPENYQKQPHICETELSNTKDTCPVETKPKICQNPNCRCQNCKCNKCQCSDTSRYKRQLSQTPNSSETLRNKRDFSKTQPSNECQKFQCHSKDQSDTCRNKRHLDDFGNSINTFFSSLFPQQFKDLHSAVKHVHGPNPNKPKTVQKASFLDYLNDVHKKNNPQYYSSPKLSQKHSMVNKISQKPNYFGSTQNFQPKNPIEAYKKQYGQVPNVQIPVNPILEMQYRKIQKQFKPTLSSPSKKSIFVPRTKPKNEVDQNLLLKKLKKLNRNYIDANLESQATDFMKKCLVPPKNYQPQVKFQTRNAIDNTDTRKKRTIILGSDELDLPTHYEIEVDSEEDEPEEHILGNRNYYENQPEEYEEEIEEEACSCEEPQSFEQFEGYADYGQEPIVQQNNPFYPTSLLQQKYPTLFNKKPTFAALAKPDVIIGKNIIKKAVQEELNNFQKKQEREQKLKEIKEKRNNPFGYKSKDGVSRNPMLMLFNVPMDFLKQFHAINKKSINPMMTTLPNLVYTAKKYFRNFGKDFKNNCINLASNIIGDFDNVNPNVIESIVQPGFQHRYKRELEDTQQNKADKKYEGRKNRGNIEPQYTVVFISSKEEQNHDDKSLELRNANKKIKNRNLQPEYSVVFENSQEIKDPLGKMVKSIPLGQDSKNLGELKPKKSQNFPTQASSKVRKKRYVIKVVDSDEVQSQVEEYLKREHNFKPLFENRHREHKPITQPKQESNDDYDYFLESSEEKVSKPKIQIKKVKPRVIIDNKGLAFMEYNGIKRPLLFGNKKKSIFPTNDKSSEEKGGKIDMLIQRAKEHTDLVGTSQNAIVPQKVIKERITHLLNEIDSLVNSKLEMYDIVCEDLIKVHQIKISIEEDWKRLLIDNKIDDIKGKIETLEKLKDLQNVKNLAVKHIGETLQKNNNEFVRKILISILAKLQRLQSLITSVVEDFETRFQMKTPFNTKKEIKFVDYLSDLKFITEKTRNDLVKNIGKIRDEEVQKDIDILNKLKKFLHTEEDEDKLEEVAKIIWEMMNACKLQKDTVKEMNKKLSRNQSVKKELKILFDLQSRFDEANSELQESLGGIKVAGKLDNEVSKKGDKPHKKDLKEILADLKRKQEEWVKKFRKSS